MWNLCPYHNSIFILFTEWTRRELYFADSLNKDRVEKDKIGFFFHLFRMEQRNILVGVISILQISNGQDFIGDLNDKEFEERVDVFCTKAKEKISFFK